MEDANLILALSYKPSFEQFLAELRIKSSGLGAQLFETVYKDFFVRSLDLKSQYNQYYSVEYATFKQYLEACHDIDLSEDEADKTFVLKIRRLPSIVDTGYEDNQLDKVLNIVKKWE